MTMTPKEAESIIGGLSKPSKMPWFAWSISAKRCKIGSKLAKSFGTICNTCYALKGRYVFPNVQKALERRLKAWQELGPSWPAAMITLINHKHKYCKDWDFSYFRWFDSGDLQSKQMLKDICTVAKGTPNTRHWLPSKEYKLVREFVNEGNDIPRNLFIKMSMPMVGQGVVKLINHPQISYTTVNNDNTERQCPASLQGNECGPCRTCWTTYDVNYPLH